jgi:MscS family membrane protein
LHRTLYRAALSAHLTVDERVVYRLGGPVSMVAAVVIWELAITSYAFAPDIVVFAHTLARLGLLVALAWGCVRALDVALEVVATRSSWISAHRFSQGLLPLVRRLAGVTVFAIAGVMALSTVGYSVSALVAGLGITGIAVALAAQKTLADVFGAFAIGVDHPFHEGDMIRLDNGLRGGVEAIGLRSTRLRTLDGTLVTIPNGKLADSQIETLSERDRARFVATFKLDLGASAAQLDRLFADLAAMLAAHPARATELPSVHLVSLDDGVLALEVMAWFRTTTWPEFQHLRDRLFLHCLEAIARAGVTLHGAPNPPIAIVPAPTTLSGARSAAR